jgi:patatin-like phospholipase/acyl hydrolase
MLPFLDKKRIFILSIDGGGIRGLIAALVLHELDKRLLASGIRRPLFSIFDMMAATSTGSLITLALANGRHKYHPSDIAEFYKIDGPKIFSRPGRSYVKHYMDTLRMDYDHRIFEEVLKELLGDSLLSEARSEILVPAFDTLRMQPYFFKRHRSRRPDGLDFYLRDIARATTAAPTYFKPARIRPAGSEPVAANERVLIEGGIFANNPTLFAYEEARRIYPRASHYYILSLGTGRENVRYPAAKLEHFTSLDWINPFRGVPLLQMTYSAQDIVSTHVLSRRADVSLYRLNRPLDECTTKIDDSGAENIACMERFARNIIEQSSSLLDDFIIEVARQYPRETPRRP